MPNNITQPVRLSDGAANKAAGQVITGATYTVGPNDNFIICGEDNTVVTLDADSNSPVYVSTIEGTTAHTGCTVTDGVVAFTVADSGCAVECVRFGPTQEWVVIGAKTAAAV